MKRKRSRFRKEVAELEVEHFKFLDESSINIDLTRLYGRAAPGQRVVDNVPQPSGPQTTTLAVIGWTGIAAPLVLRWYKGEKPGLAATAVIDSAAPAQASQV